MSWWTRLWRRQRMEEQLAKELQFHLEQRAADFEAQGYSPAEARRAARLDMGGEEQVKEDCRDARGTRWLEDLWQDFRYALRALRQQPAFAAVALLTLALGTGATTVMFTLVDSVLLKPLPFPEPDRLVTVHGRSPSWNVAAFGEQNLANPDFRDCRETLRSIKMAGVLYNGGAVSDPGEPAYVELMESTPDLFAVMGTPLYRGRAFLPEEDRPGGEPVAILGYGFWQQHFAGDPAAVGKSLVLDGKRRTIVGIGPPHLGNEWDADVFTPLAQDTLPFLQNRAAHPITVYARLRPGATIEQAQAELTLAASHLQAQYPKTNRGRTLLAAFLRPDVGSVRSTLWLLLGAVSLVLLIACVNIASLLLARAAARERELAMRAALGAGRGRLVRQCLTESGVLGLCGGLLGVALAALGLRPFVKFWPGSLPRAQEVGIDWRVLLFAVGVSLACGLLFGLAPALRGPTRQLELALRAGARTLPGSARRMHGVFVTAEIALAVVLLVSAGMLGQALLRASALDPGVNVKNVLISRMALSPSALADPARARAAWQDILDRARRMPGVQAVAYVDTVPLRNGNNQITYWPTANLPPENRQPTALATSISPDYFHVMGIRLRAGRFFDEHDAKGSEPVIIIDDVLAQHAFAGKEAVGQRLWIPDMGPDADSFLVVGVVDHVRHWGLASDDQAPVRDQFYYPFAQLSDGLVRRWSELMSIAVRTSVPPLSLVEPLRRELKGVAGDQVLYQVRTLEQLARASLDRQRFLVLLFGIFAGLSLLLSCIGIYGTLAYLTSRRVPEIGVRMALGATRANVMAMVLRQSLGMILFGIFLGGAAAAAAGRILEHSVDGVRPTEAVSVALVVPLLALAALFASFLPARRASRIDPILALREE